MSAIEDAVEAEQRFTENVARFVEEGVLPSDVADEDDDDETDATEVEAPAWLETMRFCHISPADDDRTTFCGIKVEDLPNGLVDDHPTGWDGEAICVDCGLPICPRCAQLSALEDALAA